MYRVILCLACIIASGTADYVTSYEHERLCEMASVLLTEAKYQIQQTENVRDLLHNETGFQVGMIMGRIRDKYRSIMELYRMTYNRYKYKPNLALPAMRTITPLYYVFRMELIRALEIDIENLIRVLEAMRPSELRPSMFYAKMLQEERFKKQMEEGGLSKELNADEMAKVSEMMKNKQKEEYLRTHRQQVQSDIW